MVNLGPDPQDLTVYWLKDAATAEPRLNLFGVLDPLQTAVFYGSDAVAWQAETGLATAGFSLNNDGDTVTLLRTVPGSEGPVLEPVDTAVYKDHEADDDRSSGLDELHEQWILYDGLFPYTGTLDPPGTGCRPTAGEPNYCATLVPAVPTAFGRLKAGYL